MVGGNLVACLSSLLLLPLATSPALLGASLLKSIHTAAIYIQSTHPTIMFALLAMVIKKIHLSASFIRVMCRGCYFAASPDQNSQETSTVWNIACTEHSLHYHYTCLSKT